MYKHSNTFFPGDRVVRLSHGQKLAGANNAGKVIDVDSDSGKLKVAFEDGTEDFVTPEELDQA